MEGTLIRPEKELKTARNLCFTAFKIEEVEALYKLSLTKYMIYGNEICPKTGRHHFQGYIEFKQSMKFSDIKLAAPTTHFEVRRGTQKQAIDYCTKDGDAYEHGEKNLQGHRTDLEELKADLDNGMKIKEISLTHFSHYMTMNKSIEKYIAINVEARSWKTELEIHVGPSGSGKSHYCSTNFPDAYWMIRPNGGSIWFDGYDRHETIIIDDFYGWIPWDLLLRMTDKYPLLLLTKGGTVQCLAKRIIITSNCVPLQWYNNDKIKDFTPLLRRITLYKDDYKLSPFVDFDAVKDLENKMKDFMLLNPKSMSIEDKMNGF